MLLQAQAFGEPEPPRRWPVVVALITLCGAVLIASFARSDLTRNDFERFAALRQAAWCLAVTLVIGVVLLSPLPGSVPVVLSQLLHPAAMHGIYPNELSPPLAALFWSLEGLGLFDGARGGPLFDALRLGLFIGAVVVTLVRQWTAAASFSALIESCCLLGCAFFLLLITMLLPWHLLTVIACGIVCGREPFLALAVALTVLAMLSYFLTFAIASVTLIAVLAALWALRRLPTMRCAAMLQRRA